MDDPRFYLIAPTDALETGYDNGQFQRRLKALELRLAGASYRQIGESLGIHYTTAWDDVQVMLQEYATEPADAVRNAEIARLDRLLLAHWPLAIKADPKATATVLSIMDRRARLLGLDAPQKVDITGWVREIAAVEGWPDPEQAVKDVEAILAAAAGG